jgi:hypothetical protein
MVALLMISFHLGRFERVFSVGSAISLLSLGLKLIFTGLARAVDSLYYHNSLASISDKRNF